MDIPRLTSPPSIRVYDFNSSYDRRRPTSRSSTSSTHSFPSRGPMSIPNSRGDDAPPPLPPPRHIDDFADGHDLGWSWANSIARRDGFGKRTLAPIKQGSSLYGGYMHTRMEDTDETMDDDDDYDRRGSTVSTIKSPSEAEIKMEGLQFSDDGHQSPLSSSMTNHGRLQGEKPLSQQSLEHSNNAYDKHLLSKIGKPNSPPRHFSLGSNGELPSPTTVTKLPFHGKEGNKLKSLSVSDMSVGSIDPVQRWVTSPPSAGVSPGARAGWGRDYIDFRSSSVDSSAPSSAVESEQYARARDGSRGSLGGSLRNYDDAVSLPSRSNRGSYDQGIFADHDTDFPMEETGGLRQLNIDDRTPPINGAGHSPLSKQGMKRRASSPPRDATVDERQTLHATTSHGDLTQRRAGTGGPTRTSPNQRYQHPSHGSVSSTSSAGMRNGSYASSTGLSAAGSSMTSFSSFDRHSPGGVSPASDVEAAQDSPYVTAVSLNPSPHDPQSTSRIRHDSTAPPESKSAARQMSNLHAAKQTAGSKIGGLYICECCPKKPKKFDNPDDLRVHEMEKQYTCQFCHNRFKNKNEAERHQNSLHLRRHSWSCAALTNYEAAFHPSSSPTSQTPNGPSADACGYCGEEFPNFPQPNWDRRIEHLTNIHKFQECNQAKKFYRADHFRQHLKHSHAGSSGKWTNMLENACMKDEPAPEARVGSLGEQSTRGGSLGSTTTPGGGTAGGVLVESTIDEVREES